MGPSNSREVITPSSPDTVTDRMPPRFSAFKKPPGSFPDAHRAAAVEPVPVPQARV